MATDFQFAVEEVLRAVPQQPQRQDGTSAQLADLRPYAVRLGVPVTPYIPDQLTPHLAQLLRTLPELAQKTDLTPEQALLMLRALANRLGLYDAADTLRNSQQPKS